MSTTSTISTWVPIVLRALESYGVDANALAEEAGFSHGELNDPSHRFDDKKTHLLMCKAVEASGDQQFGLRMIQYTNAQSFQTLGFALSSSNSLLDGFQRVVRYHRVITSVVKIDLQQSGDDYELLITESDQTEDTPDVTFDFCLALFSYFIRFRGKPNWRPLKVSMRRDGVDQETRLIYERFFDCPVAFGCKQSAIVISEQMMNEVVYPMPDELVKTLESQLEEQLRKLESDSVAEKVRSKIIELLPLGEPAFDSVARELNTSQRTLQRQLSNEGETYRQILDQTREGMAKQLIKKNDMQLTEIAFLLGFNDNGSFSRGFKRWTGQTPSQYRDSLKA